MATTAFAAAAAARDDVHVTCHDVGDHGRIEVEKGHDSEDNNGGCKKR